MGQCTADTRCERTVSVSADRQRVARAQAAEARRRAVHIEAVQRRLAEMTEAVGAADAVGHGPRQGETKGAEKGGGGGVAHEGAGPRAVGGVRGGVTRGA